MSERRGRTLFAERAFPSGYPRAYPSSGLGQDVGGLQHSSRRDSSKQINNGDQPVEVLVGGGGTEAPSVALVEWERAMTRWLASCRSERPMGSLALPSTFVWLQKWTPLWHRACAEIRELAQALAGEGGIPPLHGTQSADT